MEVEEDDFVVIVVGDVEIDAIKIGLCSESVSTPITIKEESQSSGEASALISELAKHVREHGEYTNIQDKPFATKCKEDNFSYEYIEESIVDSENDENDDKDYVCSEEIKEACEDEDLGDENLVKKKGKRDPSQWTSYVSLLRSEHPELLQDSKALVQRIADIMKNTTPPSPPRDFYRINDLKYECIECSEILNSITAVTRHYQAYHGTYYLSCFACGADYRRAPLQEINEYCHHMNYLADDFDRPNSLYKHEKRCRAPDAVIVLQARALAMVKRGRHRPFAIPKMSRKERNKRYLSKKRHICTECPSEFQSSMSLEAHMNMHRGERPYRCEVCGSAYTNKSALTRHQELHSNNKYVCDNCGKEFKRKTSIQYHMETHLPKCRFACPFLDCDRRYTSKTVLNIHINKEHKKLPPACPCQICPKRFHRMTVLREHMKKKHGMKLMTRNMFFRSLPTLSNTQVQQAKLIFVDNAEEGTSKPDDQETSLIRIEDSFSIKPDDGVSNLPLSGKGLRSV